MVRSTGKAPCVGGGGDRVSCGHRGARTQSQWHGLLGTSCYIWWQLAQDRGRNQAHTYVPTQNPPGLCPPQAKPPTRGFGETKAQAEQRK